MGSLTLGSQESGNDDAPSLLINGAGRGSSNTIIANEGILKLYSGVKLHGNEGMGGWGTGAIVNSRSFYMYGGVIADNKGNSSGGVKNGSVFIMEGGRIVNCTGGVAGAIINHSGARFTMSGGTIEDNNSDEGVAIYNEGTINLSEDASIPMKNSGSNKLWLNHNSSLNIDTNLSTTEKILLTTSTYIPGRQLLRGDDIILSNNYHKFILDPTATNYRIDEGGTLVYIGLIMDYYVDGELGSDSNTGSQTSPFVTLSKAVASIEDGSGVGTIHICSDIDLIETIEINAVIKLVNEGDHHVILRNPTFKGYMFNVKGQLELGDSELNGQAEARLLTINGNKENVQADRSLIMNEDGSIILNNTVVLENNYTSSMGGGIYNDGSLHMKGGVIQNNKSDFAGGGIYNYYGKCATILGGSIRNNEATNGGGGIGNYGGTISLCGGSIHDNKAIYGGGIENSGGTLNISGGKIYYNKALYGAGLSLNETNNNTMSGGEIFSNTGIDEEGIVIGKGVDVVLASFTILGDVSIASDNEVSLFDYDGFMIWKSFITVKDSLSEDIPVIKVAKYFYDSGEMKYYYPVGDQIIMPSKGYTLTALDISKFQMLDNTYGVNSLGKLADSLNENWFSIVDAEDIYYTGSEIRPSVVGKKGSTALIEGRDYLVSYKNNVDVGIASVFITGMGNYGGTVIKTFSIYDVTYTITAHAGSNGSITPSGNVTVNSNANQSFRIVPAAGYIIESLIVDGVNVGLVDSYIFIDVRGNHSISVTFKAIPVEPTPTPRPPYTPPGGGTPEPTYAPTPTLAPIPDDPIREIDAKVSVRCSRSEQGNSLNTIISISPDSITSRGDAFGRSRITIPIKSDELTEAIQDDSITSVNIDLVLPNSISQNRAIAASRILLDTDVISAARDNETDIDITVMDEDGIERYSWSFSGSDLAASDREIDELDLSISLQKAEDNEELSELLGTDSLAGSDSQKGLIINFGHYGDLPAQASVRMYVGDMGYSQGEKLYLYYYNSETRKLDTLPYSSNYVVDSEGYITVKIIHSSEYVLLAKQARAGVITSLRNQISVTNKKITLDLGSRKNSRATIEINLPKTLEQVENLKMKTSGSAVGAVTITYKSGNSKVASVDSSGKITAKKSGRVDIIVTVKLYSSKTKTFKITVIVN